MHINQIAKRILFRFLILQHKIEYTIEFLLTEKYLVLLKLRHNEGSISAYSDCHQHRIIQIYKVYHRACIYNVVIL